MSPLHLLPPVELAADEVGDDAITFDSISDDPIRVDPISDDLLDADPQPLATLLRRTRSGDAAAFEELYRRTSARIFGLTYRVLRSRDLAAEVTQEIYVEVWQQAARYDETRGSVLAWMTTMAHRRAVDRVRSVSKATARDERWVVANLQRDTDQVWELASRRLDAGRVRAALSGLTPLQRQAVIALYLDGRSQADLAAELGVPLSTVKTRVRDALVRLRTVMAAA